MSRGAENKGRYNMVCCDLCKNKFTAAYAGASQCGDGCSSEVLNGYLVGGYGSQIADGMTYRLTDSSTLREGSAVCDNCICELLEAGTIAVQSDMLGQPIHESYNAAKAPASPLGDIMDWSDISEWIGSVIPARRVSNLI